MWVVGLWVAMLVPTCILGGIVFEVSEGYERGKMEWSDFLIAGVYIYTAWLFWPVYLAEWIPQARELYRQRHWWRREKVLRANERYVKHRAQRRREALDAWQSMFDRGEEVGCPA